MTSEIATRNDTALSIETDQGYWTDQQVAALRHMGVENATEGDLGVFFHVVKRTGLDPFARQIHMIGRNTKNQRTQQWETKYTIQTGIDGYRLIGRRAADQTRDAISVGAPQWAHPEGGWRDVWSTAWGQPLAAKVTILRAGQPFTGVALFDEYKQTRKDGNLTSMWAQRPAGQLAKCAEALAWRMAFPQDLAGIYTHEEMGQSDNQAATAPVESPKVSAADFTQPNGAPVADVTDAEVVEDDAPQPMTARTRGQMFALFSEQGIEDRDEQIRGIAHIIGRPIESRGHLTEDEARAVILTLQARKGATA